MRNLNLSLVISTKNDASSGIKKVDADVGKLGAQLKKTASETVKTTAIFKKIGDGVSIGINKAIASINKMQSALKATVAVGTKMGQIGTSAVAGGAAATMVVSPKIERTMSYDRRLASLSNVAYADRDTAGRLDGIKEIDQVIQSAVRAGGGTRDQAADTYEAMIASGAVEKDTAGQLLPVLQKYATATGADSKDLADISIRAMQTFGISAEQIPEVLDRAIQAGQDGGFELADMAKWLPQQMAAAKNMGMSGIGDFSKILAANQAAVITAGTKDEAGNNLVNLLAKISSRDAANAASKIIVDGKGVDLTGSLAKARENGTSQLDAFVKIVDKIVAANPEYQKLQQRAANETDADKKATFESMGDLLQGSAVGELIQDRQALMALIALMNNRDYVKDIEDNQANATGAGDKNFAVIQSTADFKVEQAKNEWAIAEQGAFDAVNQSLGDFAVKLTEYAREYPGLAIATVAATTALTALAAAAGAAGLAAVLTGRGGFGGGKGGGGKGAPGKGSGIGGLFRGLGNGVGRLGSTLFGSVARVGSAGVSKVTGAFSGITKGLPGFNSLGSVASRGSSSLSTGISKVTAPLTSTISKVTGLFSGITKGLPGLNSLGDVAKTGSRFGKFGGVANLAIGGLSVAAIAADDSMTDTEKNKEYTSIGGGMAGAAAGAIAGAAIGSVVPVLGTAVGGLLGGIVGGFGGDFIGGWLGDQIWSDGGEVVSSTVSNKQEPVSVNIDAQPLTVTSNLMLDGRLIAEQVNRINTQMEVRG